MIQWEEEGESGGGRCRELRPLLGWSTGHWLGYIAGGKGIKGTFC